jgi:LPXTG-motif cell wall-anchored protein
MKIRLFYIVPIVISICCFLLYSLEGSSVAEDGTLVESFGLIPTGYLFLAIGIIALIATEASIFYKKKKRG